MNKQDIKMIISDIDGTLINDLDLLPENFHEMIEHLKDQGIIFVAASGRGAISIKNKIQNESDNIYVVSNNGAVTMKDDEVIHASQFSEDQFQELVSCFKSFEGNTVGVMTLNGSYVEIGSEHADESLLNEFYHGSQIVDDISKAPGIIVGISVHNKYNTKANYDSKAVQALADKYTVVHSGDQWIDAIPKSCNKGAAIDHLLDHLELTHDQSIAFGDYFNDIEMLKTVGKGFAMQDAHDYVKAAADEVIGSNNDNSVIKKIYELLEI